MTVHPILSALRHHKAGTVLIAFQIALTLAIVCNALFIIQQRVASLSRPTGTDEAHLIRIENQWVGVDEKTVGSLIASDLATLRQVPGVVNAYATNATPLSNSGSSTGLFLTPEHKGRRARTTYYFGDASTLATLGLKLVAGRNFRPDEIGELGDHGNTSPPVIIVTRALANALFPEGHALGKNAYLTDKPSTIIGVVAHLQVPWVGNFAANWNGNSTLVPDRLLSDGTIYVVRARDGQLHRVMRAAPKALLASNRMRVIPDNHGVMSFHQMRENVYASDRGMAILMGVICLIMLCVTGAGIVGLTSFWVGQRRKQIGIRRTLGARRIDILYYFQLENLLIAGAGVVLGIVLAIGLNLWLMSHFQMTRMPVWYVLIGVLALLALGQAAVFWPARRASKVPPVVATRTV